VNHHRELNEIARYMPAMTAADFCDRNAEQFGGKEALVDRRRRFTWSQVKEASDRLASNLLALGLKRDAKILVQLPNWAELFLLRLACEKAAVRLVTVTPAFRSAELAPIVRFTRPEAAIVPKLYRGFDYCELLESVRNPELKHLIVAGEEIPPMALSLDTFLAISPENHSIAATLQERRYTILDVCQIATTSGSTGIPKCVEVPLYTRLLTGWIHAQRFGVHADDTLGAVTSIVTGTADALVYNGGCAIGARIVLIDHFSPEETCAVLEAERVSVIPLVPTMVSRILAMPGLSGYKLTALRTVVNHGSSLSFVQGLQFEQRLGCRIVQGYGSVDCGGISANFREDPLEVRLGTLGRPLEGNEVKVVNAAGEEMPRGEMGRLMVRGLNADARYYNHPELNSSSRHDGYFDLGELGRLDEQGNVVLMAREKDVIIRGGQNIFPVDIEAVLCQHPQIVETSAVGMDDAEMGERVCAFVACRDGARITHFEITEFLKDKGLARFKWPERIEIIDALPRVASGHKIDKAKLKAWLKG
jgi:non-ribosomal peptide synthetase component E (peptide arylation enzyme)